MRWLADECIPAWLVAELRDAGYDVSYIAENSPSAEDAAILELALREKRLLLTEDRDFGELIFGETTHKSFGVVLLRMSDEHAVLFWPRLQEAIGRFGEKLFGAFTVISETRMRTRVLSGE